MEKHPVENGPLRMSRASLRPATRPRPYPRASAAEADPQTQLGAPAAVEDDRLPPWREKSINPENVNRSLRSAEEMGYPSYSVLFRSIMAFSILERSSSFYEGPLSP